MGGGRAGGQALAGRTAQVRGRLMSSRPLRAGAVSFPRGAVAAGPTPGSGAVGGRGRRRAAVAAHHHLPVPRLRPGRRGLGGVVPGPPQPLGAPRPPTGRGVAGRLRDGRTGSVRPAGAADADAPGDRLRDPTPGRGAAHQDPPRSAAAAAAPATGQRSGLVAGPDPRRVERLPGLLLAAGQHRAPVPARRAGLSARRDRRCRLGRRVSARCVATAPTGLPRPRRGAALRSDRAGLAAGVDQTVGPLAALDRDRPGHRPRRRACDHRVRPVLPLAATRTRGVDPRVDRGPPGAPGDAVPEPEKPHRADRQPGRSAARVPPARLGTTSGTAGRSLPRGLPPAQRRAAAGAVGGGDGPSWSGPRTWPASPTRGAGCWPGS